MTEVKIHLLPDDWDEASVFTDDHNIRGVCGAEVEVMEGQYKERFVLGLTMAMFPDTEKLILAKDLEHLKPRQCPECLAHPDYPLYLLGDL